MPPPWYKAVMNKPNHLQSLKKAREAAQVEVETTGDAYAADDYTEADTHAFAAAVAKLSEAKAAYAAAGGTDPMNPARQTLPPPPGRPCQCCRPVVK